jgi:3-oxoacyl-[acyl-carrier-protein] synthase-3
MKTLLTNIKISSIAAILPKDSVDLTSYIQDYGENEVNKIIRTTGINKIRKVKHNITASDLCEELCNHLFDNVKGYKDNIDGLIFVSQTRDYILPQTSNVLQAKLNLPNTTVCFDIPLGCSGYIHGLLQASLLVQSNSCKKVLVLAGDTTTRMLSAKDRTVSMVFGDAATATIVETGSQTAGCLIYSDGSGAKDLLVSAGGFRNPYSEETSIMKDKGDNIFRSENDLHMDGMQVFNFSISKVPPLINESLINMNWTDNDVSHYFFHQANEFMVKYLRKKLNNQSEKSPICVKEYGNTGPASIPLTITALFHEKNTINNAVMCGFGVGLSWGSFSINLSDTIIFKPINF